MFPVAAWNKLYRRELWDKVLFPKGKICEDVFTTYLLIDAAKKLFKYQMFYIIIEFDQIVL